MSDEHVAQLAILDQLSRVKARIRRPFPESIERWLSNTYGPGKYRVVQRDEAGKHIGSRTMTIEGIRGELPPEAPPAPAASSNGHGSDPPPNAITSAPSLDWKTALVTTGIPILAGVITAGFEAVRHRDPPRSELETIEKVAKILAVTNEERAATFREGMELYKTFASEFPRGESRGDGSPFPIREVLEGFGDMVRALRSGASTPSPAPPLAPAAGVTAPAPAPLGQLEGLTNEQAGERYVEQLLVTEIRRAVGKGDTPDCFCVLMEAYLPPMVLTWIEYSPDEAVLEQLAQRFPNHAEYLKGEQVQMFLRSALAMFRREEGEEHPEGTNGVPRADTAAVS